MPVVPQPTITDIKSSQRRTLRKLLDERATLGYAFSYHKLTSILEGLGCDPEETKEYIRQCILATGETDLKDIKKDMDDKISAIFAENGIKGIRAEDPVGRKIDCIVFENAGIPRLSKDLLIEKAPDFGISAKKTMEWIKAATVAKPFVAVTLREVKEKETQSA